MVRHQVNGAHGLGPKFQRNTTSVFEEAPKVFR